MEVLWTYFLGIWWIVSLYSKQHPDYDFENCPVEKDVSMERLEFALCKTAGELLNDRSGFYPFKWTIYFVLNRTLSI